MSTPHDMTNEKFIAHWNKNQDVRALIDFVKQEVRKQDEELIATVNRLKDENKELVESTRQDKLYADEWRRLVSRSQIYGNDLDFQYLKDKCSELEAIASSRKRVIDQQQIGSREDEALIRQMLESLKESRFDSLNMTMAGMQRQSAAIAAARARLGEGGGV